MVFRTYESWIFIVKMNVIFFIYSTPIHGVTRPPLTRFPLRQLLAYACVIKTVPRHVTWFFSYNQNVCVRHWIGVHKSLNLFKSRGFRIHETIWWTRYLSFFHILQKLWGMCPHCPQISAGPACSQLCIVLRLRPFVTLSFTLSSVLLSSFQV